MHSHLPENPRQFCHVIVLGLVLALHVLQCNTGDHTFIGSTPQYVVQNFTDHMATTHVIDRIVCMGSSQVDKQ